MAACRISHVALSHIEDLILGVLTAVENPAEASGTFFHNNGQCQKEIDNPFLCAGKALPKTLYVFSKLLTASSS
jgi:hypothetical protein